MEEQFTFNTDNGHGWLNVTELELIRLGINKQISTCSYIKHGRVYLEEDCDMPIFIKAYCKVNNITEEEFIKNMNYSYYDGSSPIREYNHYNV